jgi:hypothetical protein
MDRTPRSLKNEDPQIKKMIYERKRMMKVYLFLFAFVIFIIMIFMSVPFPYNFLALVPINMAILIIFTRYLERKPLNPFNSRAREREKILRLMENQSSGNFYLGENYDSKLDEMQKETNLVACENCDKMNYRTNSFCEKCGYNI